MADAEIKEEKSLQLHTPAEFLKRIIGQPVQVKLLANIEYHGKLSCLDGYMNIALEESKELVEGKVTNKFGDAFIRGNTGKLIGTT